MWWGLRWCRKTWVWEKMVPKHELFENIPLHSQGLNCKVNVCELEDHVGEKGWSLKWLTKLGPTKKTPFPSFPNYLLEITWIKFTFLYGLSSHFEEAKWDTSGVVGRAWCTPKLFDRFNCKSKVKTTKGSKVGVCSLICSTSGIKGHARFPRWRLIRVISRSTIHMDLHKPNNKLVTT